MNQHCGLAERDYFFIQETLSKLLKHKDKLEIKVFGSRARGDYKKYSDLDLWLDAVPAITRDELLNLQEAFADSDLAIQVDIVTPENVLAQYEEQIKKDLVQF